MQKLVKRTAEAQRNAANRAKRKSLKEFQQGMEERRRENKRNTKSITTDIHRARRARSSAWELGPIAPRRDTDGHMSFAAMGGSRMAPQTPLKAWEIEARCQWAGGSQNLNLAVGDRVVVMQGPDKGVIDKIAKLNMDTATVELVNTSKKLMRVPEMYRVLNSQQPLTMAAPANLPISAIRLVHPLTDPKTGITRDVIIRSLSRGSVNYHRQSSTSRWTRYVTGQNIAIPWPVTEPKVREDQPPDTRRVDVEEPTFVPTLLRAPMPSAIIDELRNRYSKFRTRHEEDFVLRKEAEEEERQLRRKEHLQMLAPVQEFNRQQRELRRARGQPELSEDMLAKIGQVIAKNKTSALSQAGLSEVPRPPPA